MTGNTCYIASLWRPLRLNFRWDLGDQELHPLLFVAMLFSTCYWYSYWWYIHFLCYKQKKMLTQWTSYCVRWKTKPTRTVDIVYITMNYQWFGVSNEFYGCYHQIRNARFSEPSTHTIFAQCWTTWSKYHNVWFCIPITIPLDPHKMVLIISNHQPTNDSYHASTNQPHIPIKSKNKTKTLNVYVGFHKWGYPKMDAL